MKILFMIVCGLMAAANVHAAVQKKLKYQPKTQRSQLATKDINTALMALRLPLKNRVVALKKQAATGLGALEFIAFDKKQTLQARWRALTALGIIAPIGARRTLEKAVKSRQWFLRNAALLAMSHGERNLALGWAKKLLDDKALVVRTAAVQVIDKLNGAEHKALLWKKLYSKQNYRAQKSLWIRRHIVKALAKFAKRGEEGRFVHLLSDDDVRIHASAVKGLEVIRGNILSKKTKSLEAKRIAWLNWWQKNQY